MPSSRSVTARDRDNSGDRWLLLITSLPPKPDYLRVKMRRRLMRIGALALKGSIYVLPQRDETIEDFEWLRHEIIADGGEAVLCSASLLAGVADEDLERLFQNARAADYAELASSARAWTASPDREASAMQELQRLNRRLDDITRVDFFGAAGRADAERAVSALRSAPGAESAAAAAPKLVGRTWVTRQGVFVDRMASAWLIKRFIDPKATFKFVRRERYRPAPGELRFDMFDGEYTHSGDMCTFETLLSRFALDDPALRALGEIVHDIDLKDERFGRPETSGVAGVLHELVRAYKADEERLKHGARIFDVMYAQLGGRQAAR